MYGQKSVMAIMDAVDRNIHKSEQLGIHACDSRDDIPIDPNGDLNAWVELRIMCGLMS